MARRRVLVVITIAYVALVCLVTLTPQPVDAGSDGVVDRLIAAILDWADRSVATAWLDYGRLEKLANVGMFVPIGLLLVLLAGRGRWWLGIVAGCAFTLFIEGMQATLLAATRFATVSDLIANSLGAAVGTALAVLLLTIAGRPARVQVAPADSIER